MSCWCDTQRLLTGPLHPATVLCRTQYQTVPLHSVEEFTALYEATQTGDESDKRPLAELSPHEVMLARLQLELQERKRYVHSHTT